MSRIAVINPNLMNYQALTLTCYENALALIKDAELLVNKGTPGHAQALAVLAFEEWSKFMSSLWVLMGWIKKEYKAFKEIFWSHYSKHRNAFSFLFLGQFFIWSEESNISQKTFADLDEYLNMSDEEKFEDFQNLLRKDDHPLSDELLTILDIELQLEKNKNFFDMTKKKGLYVDFDLLLEKVSNPLEIKKEDATSIINLFSLIIQAGNEIYLALKRDPKFAKLSKSIFNQAKIHREPLDVIGMGTWEDYRRRFIPSIFKVDKKIEFITDQPTLEYQVVLRCFFKGETRVSNYGVIDYIPQDLGYIEDVIASPNYESQDIFELVNYGFIVKWTYKKIQPKEILEIRYKLKKPNFKNFS